MKTPGVAGVQADYDALQLPNNSQLQKKEQGTNNRLAPYNPTHITAREAALNLLGLSHNDVLYDLGCGDGRLLFTAMERFYDDDYLMQEHQKIFNSALTAAHQPQQQQHDREDVKEVTFDAGTRLSVDTQSQPSVPHMMCNASDDDEEESHGVSLDISKECNLLPFALNVPQGSVPIMSPLHSHPMPPTPTRSNRKSHQKNNSFPALHLSPIQSEAISEIQDNIPLTITASSSGDEEIDQEGSEVLPNTTHNKTISDIPTICTSSSLTLGLRCVGIEYDQALVEAAKERIDNSFKMFETFDDGNWLKKRLCIRWGCVFDEWNVPDLHSNNAVDGTTEQFAQHLSLLEDATAVFVYLLPEGLKKVKPLLQEAARRRKEQMQSGNNTIDHHHQQHEEQLLQQTHRKDYSHVSDITDYDFFRVAHGSDVATDQKTSPSHPPFRVVSYMFSISGWTPTKVDRSSKGACPLYLYESHGILDSQE